MVKAGRIAALLGFALASWLMWETFRSSGPKVQVVLPSGLNARQAARLLARAGVIDSPRLFKLLLKTTGLDRQLKPGEYRLGAPMPLSRLLRALRAGPPGIRVVIPEGFSAQQIAERLDAAAVCRRRDFLRLVKRRRLEGRLFPTTYYLDSGSAPEAVIQRMVAEFDKTIPPFYQASGSRLGLESALTLASIVEREARRDAERPLIAAVYLNRLRLGMRLEADPTVQYALGYWKKGLTRQDLKVASPYNTYVHRGLPPGPICNPGLNSFEAVLHPATTDALYFVADNRGGHIFSATNTQHIRAKQKIRRELRARR